MPYGWLYAIALAVCRAFWDAYFESKLARQIAEREVPDEKAILVRDRFRAAVKRMRDNERSDPGSVSSTPSGERDGSGGMVRGSGSSPQEVQGPTS